MRSPESKDVGVPGLYVVAATMNSTPGNPYTSPSAAQPIRPSRMAQRVCSGLAPLRSSSRRNALVTPRYTA